LFLKCKHTAGSGSGKAENSCKETHQIALNMKAILAELQERKEDYEKLKQRIERLEVIASLLACFHRLTNVID